MKKNDGCYTLDYIEARNEILSFHFQYETIKVYNYKNNNSDYVYNKPITNT